MSIREIKEQIVEKINQLDDEKALYEVLRVLNNEHRSQGEIDATKYKDKLFQKHDGLLKRLA